MEFIQKKTADSVVERFLTKAAESETPLVWDRFEGQLPECGFCETGLSCRDCLQGPCISHPFRESSKLGVCGKDKDILATQSLLRLVLQGTMTYLDQLSDFAQGIRSGEIKPKMKAETDRILKEIQTLFNDGGREVKKEFPKPLLQLWEEAGISPEGIGRDLFKASQKLEGGMAEAEETLLWAFKTSLLGCLARKLHGSLKKSVFGETAPIKIEVNMGVLKKETPNILIYGHPSIVLKHKIAEAARKKKVAVMGVSTDPVLPPYSFSPVTNSGSQEIPLMTGAVDLIVAGDRFVNPSLAKLAKEWEVPVISADGLKTRKDLSRFAGEIVEQARKSFDFRRNITRNIPEDKEYTIMGFSRNNLDTKKIVAALNKGDIKGIILLSGSNNVKYTQDQEWVIMVQEFLKNDILCFSNGEASITLAKYGFLNSSTKEKNCSQGLMDLLTSLGKEVPPVLDLGGAEGDGMIDLLFDLVKTGKKDLKAYPILACFPEASRSSEVTEAMWTVAMGVSTYFWPALPVTGSLKTMEALKKFCEEKFGSKLMITTEKKMEARSKAALVLNALKGEEGLTLSGKPWK